MQKIFQLLSSQKYLEAAKYILSRRYSVELNNNEYERDALKKIIDALKFNIDEVNKAIFLKAIAILLSKLGDHASAISYFEAVVPTEQDNPSLYYDLADQCTYARDFRKGLNYYKLSIQNGSENPWSHLGAANCALALGDKEEAEKHYINSIEKEPNYSWTHYLYANFLYSQGDLHKALAEYNAALQFSNSNPDAHVIANAKTKIDELTEQLSNSQYNRLVVAINEILDQLRYDGKVIAHYTSISALKNLIFNSSPMRISEASYLNDPSEGEILWEHFGLSRINPIAEQHQKQLKEFQFRKKPFVLSFVRESRKNDLTLWRMYGKDNGNEAAGACIVLDQQKLVISLSQSAANIIPDDDNRHANHIKEKCSIYQVAYIGVNNEIIIPESAPDTSLKLSKQLESIQSILAEDKIELHRVQQQIDRISYLFKGSEYSDEREIRLVMTPLWLNPVIDQKSDPPKIYLEVQDILSSLTEVIIGPKASQKNAIMASIAYFLESKQEVSIKHSSLKFV